MQIHLVLAISVAGVLALLYLRRTIWSMRRHWLVRYTYRRLVRYCVHHRVLPPTYLKISNPTWGRVIFYVAHLGIAAICNKVNVNDLQAATSRSGQLAVLYLVPLLAVRQVHWAADLLGIHLDVFEILHKSMGAMAGVQAIIHSVLTLPRADWSQVDSVYGVTCLASILLLALLPLARRLAYELFLKSHLVLSITLAIFLWEHLKLKSRLSKLLILGTAIALAASSVIQLLLQLYSNVRLGWRGCQLGHVVEWKVEDNMTLLAIRPGRPLRFRPGQYLLVSLLTTRHASIWQRHPFTIVWWTQHPQERGAETIWVAIRAKDGWTGAIARDSIGFKGCSVWLQGPYGQPPALQSHGNVLMVASGAEGVLMQLPLLKQLVEASCASDACTRKVKVVWASDFPQVLGDWCNELIALSTHINGVETKELLDFSIYCSQEYQSSLDVAPDEESSTRSAPSMSKHDTTGEETSLGQRLVFNSGFLDVRKYVRACVSSMARRSAIIVAGDFRLRERVRRAMLSHQALHVDLIPLEYQPRSEPQRRHKHIL